jgi:hypothetical protein
MHLTQYNVDLCLAHSVNRVSNETAKNLLIKFLDWGEFCFDKATQVTTIVSYCRKWHTKLSFVQAWTYYMASNKSEAGSGKKIPEDVKGWNTILLAIIHNTLQSCEHTYFIEAEVASKEKEKEKEKEKIQH